MRIGVLCEGISDFPVIKNIIHAFFDEDDIIVNPLPEIPVVYNQKQPNNISGGWLEVPEFIKHAEFHQALIMYDYVIVQIDTDVSEQSGFDVSHTLIKNDLDVFYQSVQNKIMSWVDENSKTIAQAKKDKIIFCIAVHSIEYWLLIHRYPTCIGQKDDCFEKIRSLMAQENIANSTSKNLLAKKHRAYQEWTRDFSNRSVLNALAEQSMSLQNFYCQLDAISAP